MRLIVIFGFAIFYLFPCAFGQISNTRVRFIPEHPNRNQPVKLVYYKDSSIFHNRSKLYCKILFTGINNNPLVKDFPKIFEPNLFEEGRSFNAFFDVPVNATGIVAVFLDSLGRNIDNNNGEGYWTPVFMGIDLLPGSLSSIADLYAGGWPPEYYLKERKDVARKLYERDFELYPEIKRKFARYYLATFDIYSAEDKELFKKELNRYSRYGDLDEWELLSIKAYYSLINEKDSANKYDRLVFEKYPNGSWALLTNSLKEAVHIDLMKNPKEKWERYQKFKNTYCKDYPDEVTRNRMNERLGQLLRGMFLSFAENNDVTTWEKEVNQLDESSKYSTYRRTAILLIERQKSLALVKKNEKENITGLKLETPKLKFNSQNDEYLILYAEKLARESVNWNNQNLNAPRGLLDKPFYTDNDIRAMREEQLGTNLDVLGQDLLLQYRVEEAQKVLKEAVDLGKRKDVTINEHYIESLIKSDELDEAVKEAATLIKLGKSTEAVTGFYERMTSDDSLKVGARAELSTQLKKQMISDKMPDGTLLTMEGKMVSLKDLTGKTVVIDFWATWCSPCLIGLESAVEVVEKFKGQDDVVFLFVNTERVGDKTKSRVNKMLQEKDYQLNVFFDPDFKTANAFRVESLPTSVIIDSKGNVKFRNSGINIKLSKQERKDELTAMIELVR